MLRIKQLLYDEGFTIAGAKKRLESELSGKSPTPQSAAAASVEESHKEKKEDSATLQEIREQLRGILTLLERNDTSLT